jgi:hypothetical protein
VTPAASHLFNVNDKAEKLSPSEREHFHHVVAQLLYLCKRTRPDIQIAIDFLTTRVKSPDVNDMKKICQVISYLLRTVKLPLTLESSDLTIIRLMDHLILIMIWEVIQVPLCP